MSVVLICLLVFDQSFVIYGYSVCDVIVVMVDLV